MQSRKHWQSPFSGRWVYRLGGHGIAVEYRSICMDGMPWRIDIIGSTRETVVRAMAVPALAQALKTPYKTLQRAQLASEFIVNSLGE